MAQACTSASHRGGPGWIPAQPKWDLWWTKCHGTGFALSNLVQCCQYHSLLYHRRYMELGKTGVAVTSCPHNPRLSPTPPRLITASKESEVISKVHLPLDYICSFCSVTLPWGSSSLSSHSLKATAEDSFVRQPPVSQDPVQSVTVTQNKPRTETPTVNTSPVTGDTRGQTVANLVSVTEWS